MRKQQNACMREVCAVLQAGGRGARMGAATEALPKPLINVGGVPMIERLLVSVYRAGIRDIQIIVGWLGEHIVGHVQSLCENGHFADASIRFIHEHAKRGNAGSLSELRGINKTVLFTFSDLVTDLDFQKLLVVHEARKSDITLTSHYESHRVRLGELVTDGEIVRAYCEKPLKRFLICSGIAVLRPVVLQCAKPVGVIGLADFVTGALTQGFRVTHWVHNASWYDVNSPEERVSLEQAMTL